MIQVIRAREKGPSTAAQFAQAFGNAAGTAAEGYGRKLRGDEEAKKEQLMRYERDQDLMHSYEDILGQYEGDPESQRLIKTHMQLRGHPDQAKELGKQLQEVQKQKNPKAPAGGLTGQAVPPEVSMAANKILQEFPKANADQLKMMMDEIGIPPAYSNGYVENRRRQDERTAASKDKTLELGQKRAEKVLDKADRISENLPLQESYVNSMEDAVVNGDLSFWSPDNWANITGLESLRTAKGAQFLSSAKNYFIDDLKASGARPNMFIEKQLVDALAKIGRSEEANLAVLESFKFKNDLQKNWLETVRGLEKHYDETLGYLPGNISRVAEEMNKPFIEQRQKQYESRLKEIAIQEKMKAKKTPKGKKESKPMVVDVTGPDGQIYEINSDEVDLLPEGYRLK